MKEGRNLRGLAVGIGFMLMIFDSRLVLEGAKTGLELCLQTVIPSLFPFLVISMMLTRSMGSCGVLRAAAKALRIPESAATLLIPAFLGGYPVGARCVSDQYRAGHLKKEQAERLLAFCNNAGPAFFFGMVGSFFPERCSTWILWLIHLVSAALTGISLPPADNNSPVDVARYEKNSGKDILPAAMEAMGIICGWLILFRCLTAFLDRWFLWLLPQWLQVLITGLLELTNGCLELPGVYPDNLRFLICSCMLSFGGICVLMQTASVTRGLSLRFYLLGKVLQTIYCFMISLAVLSEKGWILLISLPVFSLILRKNQKSSGIPKYVPV